MLPVGAARRDQLEPLGEGFDVLFEVLGGAAVEVGVGPLGGPAEPVVVQDEQPAPRQPGEPVELGPVQEGGELVCA